MQAPEARVPEMLRTLRGVARDPFPDWSTMECATIDGGGLRLTSGELYEPRQFALTAIRLAAGCADALGTIPGFTDRSRWLEVSRKLTTYRLFVSADRLLASFERGEAGLEKALKRLSNVNAYSRIWVTEGLGWYYCKAALQKCSMRRLLFEGDRVQLPAYSLIPLHTGAALALAHTVLGDGEGCDVHSMLKRLRQYSEQFFLPEFVDVTFEALGLVTITLYPHLASNIERALWGREALSFFWHGVGRGLYFLPLSFLPLPAVRRWLFDLPRRRPASQNGRDNSLAGLAWATTLVNVESPEVLHCCLSELDEITTFHPAFGNGVRSALMVWLETSREAKQVNELRCYRPAAAQQWRIWNRAIATPAAEAQHGIKSLRSGKMWSRIFRFQPFERLNAPMRGQ